MKIRTGKGTAVPLSVLSAIWSVSAVSSLPGLAVSPILGSLNTIFPSAGDLEIQMLTSLPSLLIIPFVLLAGRLAVGRDKLGILTAGLTIFLLSGIACLFIRHIAALILASCILGIGAGMVIPFSTGLVVDYFAGDRRIRQLGYSSAVNNLTLVLATALSGYLAGIDWHLAFLVYTLPALSLLLTRFLRRQRPGGEAAEKKSIRSTGIERRRLVRLMALYFFLTYAVLAITYYASFLSDDYRFPKTFSGLLISLFFLAIMAPGLALGGIIRRLRRHTPFTAVVLISLGLLCFGIFRSRAAMAAGSLAAGFGYGILQPLIYDKTSQTAPPGRTTLALAFVMSVNYLAILLCPFLVSLFERIAALHGNRFPFLLNGLLSAVLAVLAYRRRGGFTLGLDPSYYE